MKQLDELFRKQKEQGLNRYEDEPTTAFIKFATKGRLFAVGIERVREVVDDWKITPYPHETSGHVGIVNIRGQILPVIDPFASDSSSIAVTSDEHPEDRLIILETKSGEPFGLFARDVQKIVLQTEVINQHATVNIDKQPVKIIDETDLLKGFGDVA